MRAFFAALAIPLTTGVALAVSVVTLDVRGPVVALLLNAFLVSEVAGFSHVFALRLPDWYFRLHAVEREWIYEAVGVKLFKRLMRSRVYRRVNPGFRLSGGRRGLDDLLQTMQSSEAAHALVFVTVGAFVVVALVMNWLDAAVWLMLCNVLFNGYPVMLQRYNRRRLQRVLMQTGGVVR